MRPCATSTSCPVRPSGSATLRTSRSDTLPGSEDAITRVAEPRHDVAVLVERAVDGAGVHGHVGMRLVEVAEALGTRDQAHEADRARARFLEPLDRGDGGIAGGEHRIEHDGVALPHAAGHLEVVLHGAERARVAVEAHMTHARAGYDVQEAVEQARSRTQDRHEDELLAVDEAALHALERRLDL